jgi:DNA processing protein
LPDNQIEELSCLYTLLGTEGIGPQKILSLLKHFDVLKSIFAAGTRELVRTGAINPALVNKIQAGARDIASNREKVLKTLDRLKKMNGSLITFWDSNYPDLLKKIYSPPLILYTLGSFIENDRESVAIVGTRLPSPYGKNEAEKFAAALARKNITVVSGLARGIDSIAHDSALRSGGRTIAVIGSGLDVIYPPENRKLFERVIENGAVISEYEFGTKPDAQNFPKRNRIIAGISVGTLVVETRFTGGAMQTAAHALDQNREVFAVPGNLNVAQSEGPNSLIQRGEAKLVTCVEDILIELRLDTQPAIKMETNAKQIEISFFEQKVYDILGTEPKQIDEISASASLSTSECLVNLLTLELKGFIRQLPGKMFVRE